MDRLECTVVSEPAVPSRGMGSGERESCRSKNRVQISPTMFVLISTTREKRLLEDS